MKVSEVTTRDLQLIEPTQSIREAARLMAEMDASIMPVRESDRPFDMISDCDIAVRAVIESNGPNTPVREMMTNDLKYYHEDDGREFRPGALAVRPNLVSCARSAVANKSAISPDRTFTLAVESVQVPFEGYVVLPDPRQIEPVE